MSLLGLVAFVVHLGLTVVAFSGLVLVDETPGESSSLEPGGGLASGVERGDVAVGGCQAGLSHS